MDSQDAKNLTIELAARIAGQRINSGQESEVSLALAATQRGAFTQVEIDPETGEAVAPRRIMRCGDPIGKYPVGN